jgi:hypothetical protein
MPAVRALETAKNLEKFRSRGAGTDAERRAARWLAAELGRTGREVVVEPFWCRPNWALAHAWHVALALAGSLVAVSSPRAGGGILLAALVFVLVDVYLGYSPGRWLTRARASQNVVALPPTNQQNEDQNLRLLITANYDAGRTGLAFRDFLRHPTASIRKDLRGKTLGWLGWLAVAIVWLLVVAIVRLQGHNSTAIGFAQLPPTIALVLGLALLLDLASSQRSPAAGDNGTGVAIAVELARALDAAPPRHVDIEVVLTGASDIEGIGLRRYLRARRRSISPLNTAVLGIAASPAGRPCWWSSEGRLFPVRSAPRMRQVAARVADEQSDLNAIRHSDRSCTPAFPALAARIPALAIGARGDYGVAPRSHQSGDTAAEVHTEAVEQVVEFGLMLVDAIDAELAARERASAATPA